MKEVEEEVTQGLGQALLVSPFKITLIFPDHSHQTKVISHHEENGLHLMLYFMLGSDSK